jgi:hypothetical protein
LRGEVAAVAAMSPMKWLEILDCSSALKETGSPAGCIARVRNLVKAALKDIGTRVSLFDIIEDDTAGARPPPPRIAALSEAVVEVAR